MFCIRQNELWLVCPATNLVACYILTPNAISLLSFLPFLLMKILPIPTLLLLIKAFHIPRPCVREEEILVLESNPQKYPILKKALQYVSSRRISQ